MYLLTLSFTLVYVKSHTRMGDDNHPVGVVIAEIVKGNIPVKNGVIHLIHKPLMVVDGTVKDFLEVSCIFLQKFLVLFCSIQTITEQMLLLHYRKLTNNL